MRALDADREAALTAEASAFPQRHKVGVLIKLAGIGPITATALVAEVFHRRFQSRRRLASYLGLAPVPYASGGSERDQGIGKAGNQPARSLLVELAWGWLRHQPGSGLAAWCRRGFAERGKRGRKVGIVAFGPQACDRPLALRRDRGRARGSSAQPSLRADGLRPPGPAVEGGGRGPRGVRVP
jgi:transposase